MRRTTPVFLARSLKLALTGAAAGALTLGGIAPAFAAPTDEAEITVASGESIEAALATIAPGGTITVEPGVYTEELRIEKPVTIVGAGDRGDVVLRSPVRGEPKLIDVYNTHDVTLSNLSLDGADRASDALQSSGVDANGVRGLLLDRVTTSHFGKNGIAITAKWTAESEGAADVTMRDVVSTDNAWAGVAFYTTSQGIPPATADISGATFQGVTTVSGNGAGIQFGDPGDENAVTGPDGGPVALGTIAAAGNAVTAIVSDRSVVTVDRASTVDGRQITAADVPGLTVTPLISTAATVTASPTGAVLAGDDVTVTATVAPVTDGTFEIFDGSERIGGGAAVAGSFTLTTSGLAAGSHHLTAVFTPTASGDFAASTSEAVTVTVNVEQATPVPPPATDSDALAELVAQNELDVAATTESFVPSGDGEQNPLDDFDASKPLSGELPWSNDVDSFVDVYVYSTPVFLGTFPIVDGVVQLTGIDLSALEAGDHHLVLMGQTSQEVAVLAITLAADETDPDAGGAAVSDPPALAATGADIVPGLLTAGTLLGLGLALLAAAAVRRRIRRAV